MKLKLVFLFAILNGFLASAQDKKKECERDFTAFEELHRADKFDEAYEMLAGLRKKCPTFSEALYTYGEAILNHKMEVMNNGDEKNAVARDFAKLYDEYDKNYPQNAKNNSLKKALVLYRFQAVPEDEVYALLEQAFKANPAAFKSPEAVDAYATLLYNRYKAKDKGVTIAHFIETSSALSLIADQGLKLASETENGLLLKQKSQELSLDEKIALQAAAQKAESFEIISKNLDKSVKQLTNCDALTAYYYGALATHSADGPWLEMALYRLDTQHCDRNAVFPKLADAYYKVSPTATAAFYMGVLAQRDKNTEKATAYFNESISKQSDKKEKARLYFRMANSYSGKDNATAKKYATQAMVENPAFSQPYFFLAQLYTAAGDQCGTTAFEKKALYWLAAETVMKSVVAEPKMKVSAEQIATGYRKKAPSKEEIAAGKMKGKQVAFGCWIQESVSVPKL